MKVPYTYLEVEAIDRDYDEQVPLNVIAENVNRDYHGGKQVRTASSVKYVIKKLYGEDGDEWFSRLEETWLNGIGEANKEEQKHE
jgi:hypothetical protein